MPCVADGVGMQKDHLNRPAVTLATLLTVHGQARYPRHSATLMRIAGDADNAKEAKRPMKLPYGRERVMASKKQCSDEIACAY